MTSGRRFDAAVVGLGVLGAFALRAMARRGLRVIGFDRFDPPHPLGSSHGRSRIIREAYFEHPLYVPLVRDAWRGWRELEAERGVHLFRRTGLLTLGPPAGRTIEGTLASAHRHDIEHDVLDAGELLRWFPGIRVRGDGEVGVHEPGAGVLQVEGAIQAALDDALAHGAEVRSGTPVEDMDRPGGFDVDRVVAAVGSWLPSIPGMRLPLVVERQVVFWFELRAAAEAGPGARAGGRGIPPVGLREFAPGRHLYWIVEDDGEEGGGKGVIKAALHHGGAAVPSIEAMERTPGNEDEAALRAPLDDLFPGRIGDRLRAVVCPYTNTPDGHFLVGPDPEHPRRILLGGGSGHAFKFAPALGERVADWVTGNRTPGPEDPFLPRRLAGF